MSVWEGTLMVEQMEMWPTVRIVLAWLGLIVGGVVALGCFGGALSGLLQGRTNPFGKGKADFWISAAIGLIFAGLAAFSAHHIFIVKRESPDSKPPVNIGPPPGEGQKPISGG